MDNTKLPSIQINYLYFGIFFLLLAFMSTGSVLVKENFLGSRFFFLLYAYGQIIVEVSGLIFLGYLLERYTKPIYFWLFIGLTFFLMILHVVDYLMDRILDLSAWDTASFALAENLDSFLYLLDASGISLWIWGVMFLFVLTLPLIGIFLYQLTYKIVQQKALYLKLELFFYTFVCIPIALFLWDFSASSIIHPDAYTAFIKSLPWKFTFIQPKNILIEIKNPLLLPPQESSILSALAQVEKSPSKKPNIYLFIVESLREDFLSETIAPHLSHFRKDAIVYDTSVSNANGTHPSWFSIFHSQFSIFWNEYKKQNWAIGSPALQLLKKWGYQIRVYTSAQLGYYRMDELIFGKEMALIDSFHPFYHSSSQPAWQSDESAIHAALENLSKEPRLQEGQLFIFFLDSTHFDYSWPKHKASPCTPFANHIAYFKAYQTAHNIELIKNSYRNAIHHIDSLFGTFLEKAPRIKDSIIAFMGDHAEEFFEHGHLFHNSHLIDEQIRIPLYLRFGSNPPTTKPRAILSQMDFFPSVVDYLSGRTFSFLQGESIFRPSKWPYAMICRFNGGKTPYEFSFHNGLNKVILQFQPKNNVFSSSSLKIKSLWNCKNQNVSECKSSIERWLEEEFEGAFERLFPSKNLLEDSVQ